MSTNDWLPLLRKVFLFSSFTGEQLNHLARKMTLVSYPKGAVLFRENDPGESLYIILSGTIQIVKNNDEKEPLAFLNRGDVLGEMGLLAAETRPHTAIVDSTSDLLVLTKRDFDNLLEKNPTMALHLSRLLSSRLASYQKAGTPMGQPSQMLGVVLGLPHQDQVVFAVNLGLSLVEQTRKKTLLVVADEGSHMLMKSLGLESLPLNEVRRFNEHVMIHPSGLELLEVESTVLEKWNHSHFSPLLSQIRDHYDIAVFILPSRMTDAASGIFSECDNIVLVAGPQSPVTELASLKDLSKTLAPTRKVQRLWLSMTPESVPEEFKPCGRFPWNMDWGRWFVNKGSPFFTHQASAGQRAMDRLARQLSHLVIGFAMGSGAAFGYALIGMLRVLEREGIYPDVISGTSMGALIGAFYSTGLGPDRLEEIAISINRKKLWQMADPIIPRTGLIRGNGVLNFLRENIGDKNFEDLNLPFACVATDIQTGREIVLDKGNVAEAVRASLSLPFFFQPFYLEGRYLVDGGLVNPVPTSITLAQGANIIISANLTSKAGERKVPGMIGWWRRRFPSAMRGPSVLETLMKTIYVMQYEIASARAELAHVVMQIKLHDLLWWDLDRAPEMIKMGEASAEEVLPKIKSLLPFYSNSCRIDIGHKGRKNY